MSRSHFNAIRPRYESDSEGASQAPSTNVSDQEEDMSDGGDSGSSSGKSIRGDDTAKDITFGALAEAQAKFSSESRKRKHEETDQDVDVQTGKPTEWRKEAENVRRRQEKNTSRSSKHAPTISSTRNPVSRKRAIFSPPPAEKFRDPRFDAAIVADARRGNTSSTHAAHHNYAFLSEYQATEVLELKAKLKKAKDPTDQAQLKRQIMSLEAKLRNTGDKRREEEILREHKRQERQAIKDGKKARPYYLKESELKKRVLEERKAAMGAKARDKSEKRKRKREKTREAGSMPVKRRSLDS